MCARAFVCVCVCVCACALSCVFVLCVRVCVKSAWLCVRGGHKSPPLGSPYVGPQGGRRDGADICCAAGGVEWRSRPLRKWGAPKERVEHDVPPLPGGGALTTERAELLHKDGGAQCFTLLFLFLISTNTTKYIEN